MTDRELEDADSDPSPPEEGDGPPVKGGNQTLWVGVFLILGMICILAALFILTDAAIFRGRYIVSTNVPDAGGIRRGDPVQMLGVNIGRVQRFKIAKDNVEIREYPSMIRVDGVGNLTFDFEEITAALGSDFNLADFEEIMSTHYGRMVHFDDKTMLFSSPEEAAEYIDFDLKVVT